MYNYSVFAATSVGEGPSADGSFLTREDSELINIIMGSYVAKLYCNIYQLDDKVCLLLAFCVCMCVCVHITWLVCGMCLDCMLPARGSSHCWAGIFLYP